MIEATLFFLFYLFICLYFIFKLSAAISNKLQNDFIGDSVILHKLKQKVIDLAVTPGVIYSVQSVAQSVLRAGWILLLPTADERAKALSLLLPGKEERY